jgi:hypothetical protein
VNQDPDTAITIVAVIAALGIALSLVIDRWIVPWRAKTKVDRLIREIKEGKPTSPRSLENSESGKITADEHGFQISLKGEATPKLPWAEVTEIHAFKRDLLTVDIICQALRMKFDGLFYEIHAEMSGYHDFQLAMERHLPAYDRLRWYPEVSFPAFETNYRVIWTRYLKDEASRSV